jgi:hypothetical protein
VTKLSLSSFQWLVRLEEAVVQLDDRLLSAAPNWRIFQNFFFFFALKRRKDLDSVLRRKNASCNPTIQLNLTPGVRSSHDRVRELNLKTRYILRRCDGVAVDDFPFFLFYFSSLFVLGTLRLTRRSVVD